MKGAFERFYQSVNLATNSIHSEVESAFAEKNPVVEEHYLQTFGKQMVSPIHEPFAVICTNDQFSRQQNDWLGTK